MDVKKSNKPIIFIAIVLAIAGLADLKYKGKFYDFLPKSVQQRVDKYF